MFRKTQKGDVFPLKRLIKIWLPKDLPATDPKVRAAAGRRSGEEKDICKAPENALAEHRQGTYRPVILFDKRAFLEG